VLKRASIPHPTAGRSRRAQRGESLQQALEHVMSTGEYRTIANVWGVEKGMIDKSVITARSGDSMAALLRSAYW
jgi:hypothetical protein